MRKAAAAAADVARNVKPDQFDLPTACADWDVRALANHVTHWAAVVSERTAHKLPVPTDGSEVEGTDYTAGDWPAFFTARLDRAVEAWGLPGAWDGETTMAGDMTPAGTIGLMLLGELVVHGWDLAIATGQDFPVDDDVAEAALRGTEQWAEQAREYGVFGAEIAAPADATPLHKVLAMSGRDSSWRP
ncbi:TIGR03086 family metal-binding protein [Actinokineospora sp.]|uniref:TIGR03086 family metal-binding protein n=1 Tax=Actinokineospora sp. TaxID=1872133 RepID=UPI0040380AD5